MSTRAFGEKWTNKGVAFAQNIAGHYRIRSEIGPLGYWRDGSLLARSTNTNNPLFKTPSDSLMALNRLAVDFPEKVTPEKYTRWLRVPVFDQ